MEDFTKTLKKRMAEYKKQQSIVAKKTSEKLHRIKVIENNVYKELPIEIDELIDNKAYRPRYRLLIKEGHLDALRILAERAHGKGITYPSRWFAKCCSKERWESTLKWLLKLKQVVGVARTVAERLAVSPKDMAFVYKAAWKYKNGLLRHLATAQEVGKNPYRLFCWLVNNPAPSTT